MAEPTLLERVDDPRVSAFRHLNDHAFRRRIEAGSGFASGIFVVEGWLAVQRLLESRHTVGSVLVDIDRFDRLAGLLAGRSVIVITATRSQIAEIVGFDLHRGIVAVAERDGTRPGPMWSPAPVAWWSPKVSTTARTSG